MQRDEAKDQELRNIALKLTDAISEMNSVLGETTLNVTFKEGNKDLFIPPTVDDKKYEIRITRYEVLIKQEDRINLESFIGNIHLWKPEKQLYEFTEIHDLDEKNKELRVVSYEDFGMERKEIVVDGEIEYMTFVYL
jgi:hypothetical protein